MSLFIVLLWPCVNMLRNVCYTYAVLMHMKAFFCNEKVYEGFFTGTVCVVLMV
jgi:hypothetical protein